MKHVNVSPACFSELFCALSDKILLMTSFAWILFWFHIMKTSLTVTTLVDRPIYDFAALVLVMMSYFGYG